MFSIVILLLLAYNEMGYIEIGRIFFLAVKATLALFALTHMVQLFEC